MMKKLVLTVAALCALASTAFAGRIEKPILWATYPLGLESATTSTQPLASGALDTTEVFNLLDADISGARTGGKLANFVSQDSVLIGYIVCYSDSSADVTNTLTAVTATIDASWDGNDWAVQGTHAGVAASDDPIVAIPIYFRPGLSQQSVLTSAQRLRIRFTTVTGIMTAARVRLVYWGEDRMR